MSRASSARSRFAMLELILKSFAEQHGRMQWPGMTPQAARSVLRAIAGPSTFRELSCKHASDHALSLSTDLAMSQRRESFHGAIENGARLVQGKDLLLDQLFESSGANDAASKARS
jgi:hypothetical protein